MRKYIEAIVFPNRYHFYLVFSTHEKGRSPWHQSQWLGRVEPILRRLISASAYTKDLSIDVLSGEDDKPYFKDIKHGRLSWKKESFDKWTLSEERKAIIYEVKVVVPRYSVCERKEMNPDIFISMQTEDPLSTRSEKPRFHFDVLTVVAIKDGLAVDHRSQLIELSKAMNSKVTIYRKRRWDSGLKRGNWTFYNWIMDTHANGIYKGRSLHEFDSSSIQFEPVFEVVYKK